MVILIDSSSSKSPEFLSMIQQMVFNASFFWLLGVCVWVQYTPSARLDVCPLRQPKYILFSSLGIMPRVSTTLNLPIAHIDTRPIAICTDTYKFVAYPYSIWQKFTIDNKVMVTSHFRAVRKLHVWRTDLNTPWDPNTGLVFSGDDLSLRTACILLELPSTAAVLSRKPAPPSPPWSRRDLDVMY